MNDTVFGKLPKKSHSTWRAKRAMFTFWVDKSYLKMPKMVNLKAGSQTVLPDVFGDFLTLWMRKYHWGPKNLEWFFLWKRTLKFHRKTFPTFSHIHVKVTTNPWVRQKSIRKMLQFFLMPCFFFLMNMLSNRWNTKPYE